MSNHHYIKVAHQGTTYGPFLGPISFGNLTRMIRVTMRSQPILTSMDKETVSVFTDANEDIPAGMYSLASNPNILYDEAIDGAVIKPAGNRFGHSRNIETQTDSTSDHSSSGHGSGICSLPLERSDMESIVEDMLHLLSSIPPRYIKYNKVLSLQMKITLDQVNQWIRHLSTIYSEIQNDKTGLHSSGVSIDVYITFVQYRILDLMHDVWKRVWTRFPPTSRVFNVSTIYTYNSLEKAEHILNCLSSWRRMMDAEAWDKIQKHNNGISMSNVKKRPITAKDRLLEPSRLSSVEHAGDQVNLAQSFHDLKDVANNQELQAFRIQFIQELKKKGAFKNNELQTIKSQMLKERKLPPLSFDFISKAIEKEFRLYS